MSNSIALQNSNKLDLLRDKYFIYENTTYLLKSWTTEADEYIIKTDKGQLALKSGVVKNIKSVDLPKQTQAAIAIVDSSVNTDDLDELSIVLRQHIDLISNGNIDLSKAKVINDVARNIIELKKTKIAAQVFNYKLINQFSS